MKLSRRKVGQSLSITVGGQTVTVKVQGFEGRSVVLAVDEGRETGEETDAKKEAIDA